MPKVYIILLGTITFFLSSYFSIYHIHAPQIQADIESRANDAINKYMLRGIELTADGRDVILAGKVLNAETKKRGEEVVKRVNGVRKTYNTIIISEPEPVKIILPEDKNSNIDSIK